MHHPQPVSNLEWSEHTDCAPALSHVLLKKARRHAPSLDRLMTTYRDTPLQVYFQSLAQSTAPPFQPRDDLIQVVYHYVERLLGKVHAMHTAEDFQRRPMAMTANHHGVDFFAQSVQGTLLFALSAQDTGPRFHTVPIFACGNIPLNNLSFPMGLLLYPPGPAAADQIPVKLPLMPNRLKRSIVGAVPAFSIEDVHRAIKRLKGLTEALGVTPEYWRRVGRLFEDLYTNNDIFTFKSYSDQAVILNHRLWRRMFADPAQIPELIYLEAEKIATELLLKDLSNENSLVWAIFFDDQLRQALLEILDGHRVCWNLRSLRQRWVQRESAQGLEKKCGAIGTVFFWGLDASARKVPLDLIRDDRGALWLHGVEDRGNIWHLPFNPKDLAEGLRTHRLIPSLFVTYTTLAFARGIACVGGYYQSVYLPEMQQGLLQALQHVRGYEAVCRAVRRVPTGNYLSGMQPVMLEEPSGGLIPAGPLEIAAAGGLSEEDLEKVRGVSFRDAHVASLLETVSDLFPEDRLPKDWKTTWSSECGKSLKDKVVVKRLP